MKNFSNNRFDDFFESREYIFLKNYLYNYTLRKRAIIKNFKTECKASEINLEVGCGISPMLAASDNVIYIDLSHLALKTLVKFNHGGQYVAGAADQLPFRSRSISTVICSEVLEHLSDDQAALNEISRILRIQGTLILTVPHKKNYFAVDDRFVNHFRRYELIDILKKLKTAGFSVVAVKKILGPLEKITMMIAVYVYSFFEDKKSEVISHKKLRISKLLRTVLFAFKWINKFFSVIIWLDSRITPRSLSAVILVSAKKISDLD